MISGQKIAQLLAVVGMGYIFAQALLVSPVAAGATLVALVLFFLFSRTPLTALSLYIALAPFSAASIFELSPIPGLKPLNILFLFLIFVLIFHSRESVKMDKTSFIFMAMVIFFHTLGILRSIKYLDTLSYFWGENLSSGKYIISYLFKPLIYVMPLVIISKYTKSADDLDKITNSIILSIVALSSFLIYLYLFKATSKTNFESIRWLFADYLHLHGNGLVNFYIFTIPFIFTRVFLKKDFFGFLALGLSIPVFGLLYSRTGYVLLFVSIIIYCVLSKRTKYIPIIISIVFVLFLSLAFQTIKDRAFTGLDSGDTYEISGGRFQGVWQPLIKEYLSDPSKLITGNGRYGTITSRSFNGGVVNVGHPHNMYLEIVIDSGLIGFFLIMLSFVSAVFRVVKNFYSVQDPHLREYQYAVLASLVSFMISGLSGRSFFPDLNGAYLWILLGYAAAIANISKSELRGTRV